MIGFFFNRHVPVLFEWFLVGFTFFIPENWSYSSRYTLFQKCMESWCKYMGCPNYPAIYARIYITRYQGILIKHGRECHFVPFSRYIRQYYLPNECSFPVHFHGTLSYRSTRDNIPIFYIPIVINFSPASDLFLFSRFIWLRDDLYRMCIFVIIVRLPLFK